MWKIHWEEAVLRIKKRNKNYSFLKWNKILEYNLVFDNSSEIELQSWLNDWIRISDWMWWKDDDIIKFVKDCYHKKYEDEADDEELDIADDKELDVFIENWYRIRENHSWKFNLKKDLEEWESLNPSFWKEIKEWNIILLEEKNLFSLDSETLKYSIWEDPRIKDFKFFDNQENYRIFSESKEELWFISYSFYEEEKELYINMISVFENYAWSWIWTTVIESLIKRFDVKKLSLEIIDWDDWYTYWFWNSIKEKICDKEWIQFNASYE